MRLLAKIALLAWLSLLPALAQDSGARTIEQAFIEGYINGHVGLFGQQSSNKQPSFADINMSLSYETLRYQGYKIGAEAWLNGKLFEQFVNNFSANKDIFTITKLYADFYNQYEKFGMRVGRFGINEEWITHNVEGFGVDYDGFNNISLNFTWAFRNAYTENYYNSGFRRMYRVIGAMLLRGNIDIPTFPVRVTPYLYFAPGVFFSPALKASMNLPLPKDIYLRSNIHFLSYIQDKSWYGDKAGAGLLFMLDSSVYWNGLEGGIGISATDADGAPHIDAFGQHTMFERPVGMFWGGSTTIYSFVRYSMEFLTAHAAIRNSFINGNSIFNWEIKVSGSPLMHTLRGLELGISTLGLHNSIGARDYFGSADTIAFRVFVQYKF